MKRFLLAALCLVLCLAPAAAEQPESKQATIAYLRSLQTPDGGFLPALSGDVSVGSSQSSGHVQLTLGTSNKTRVQGTWACS